jgi:hypothetical protein
MESLEKSLMTVFTNVKRATHDQDVHVSILRPMSPVVGDGPNLTNLVSMSPM